MKNRESREVASDGLQKVGRAALIVGVLCGTVTCTEKSEPHQKGEGPPYAQEANITTGSAQLDSAKRRVAPPRGAANGQGLNGVSQGKPLAKQGAVAGSRETLACPDTMRPVPGGKFTVGTLREVFDKEENPQFTTQVASFCADTYEVSAKEFEQCVSKGKCKAAESRNKTCNTVKKGRGHHPINCITHQQAVSVCALRDARLPTEIEWEYMARGGAEMRKFPWGTASPDDNTCWKHPGSCKRGAFTEGAFGLHDVVGNVWEWTDSWFGRYPWPLRQGRHKVFRGGSWSRRFEKWMRPTLRNRVDPKKFGSHLGVRCVSRPADVFCPYGKDDEGLCRAGVEQVKCLQKLTWNGVRCAPVGDNARCGPGTKEEKGFGCVRTQVLGKVEHKLDTQGVTRARSPQFDADCVQNTPGRPHAYRFSGGGHLARNVVGKSMGCKNRDVGVGFNSSCCP